MRVRETVTAVRMLSPGPTARRAHPHHPGGPRSAVALGTLGHFPALRINGLQSAASRHSRPELRLHCPPCPELGLAAAKDAERSAVPVNTRESGGRACVRARACRPRSEERPAVFRGGCAASLPPAASGSCSCPCPCRFHIWAVDRAAAAPRLPPGRGSSRPPVRLPPPGEAEPPAGARF